MMIYYHFDTSLHKILRPKMWFTQITCISTLQSFRLVFMHPRYLWNTRSGDSFVYLSPFVYIKLLLKKTVNIPFLCKMVFSIFGRLLWQEFWRQRIRLRRRSGHAADELIMVTSWSVVRYIPKKSVFFFKTGWSIVSYFLMFLKRLIR